MHIAIRPDLDQRNGEPPRLNEHRRIAGSQSVALDRAGITVFPNITFLVAARQVNAGVRPCDLLKKRKTAKC